MIHMQTKIHKIHHDLDLGEATTFPFIIFFVPGHEANIQMSFCSETPKWNLEILKIKTFAIVQAHNFVCRPPIEVKSTAKL